MKLRERFEMKYVVAESGCWEWTAHVSTSGYGRLHAGRTPAYAHRVSYELYVGPIPTGMHIDHLCRNRRCVNPDHLEAVTQRVNNARTRRPTCKRGHLFDSVVRRKSGVVSRRCLTCHRAGMRRHKAKNAGTTSVSPVVGVTRLGELGES